VKNEHALLLFLGLTPSKKANRNSPGFWASESETSKIVLTFLERFLQWEVTLTSNQETGVADMIDQGFLPFLNLFAWGKPGKEGFEPATDPLRVYLQLMRPLIIVCLGWKSIFVV